MLKAMMRASFIKPLKKDSGKDQSKYALLGQPLEGPILKKSSRWLIDVVLMENLRQCINQC